MKSTCGTALRSHGSSIRLNQSVHPEDAAFLYGAMTKGRATTRLAAGGAVVVVTVLNSAVSSTGLNCQHDVFEDSGNASCSLAPGFFDAIRSGTRHCISGGFTRRIWSRPFQRLLLRLSGSQNIRQVSRTSRIANGN
jgi:hypothetical protein